MKNKLKTFLKQTLKKEQKEIKNLSEIDIIKACTNYVLTAKNLEFFAQDENQVNVSKNNASVLKIQYINSEITCKEPCYYIQIRNVPCIGENDLLSYRISSKNEEFKYIEKLFKLCVKKNQIRTKHQQILNCLVRTFRSK